MRSPRLKLHDCSAVYHCVSRIVGGQFLLGDLEKEQFRQQTYLLADFCGVEALGYAVMSDHFHLAIRVPAPGQVSDEEIARRLRVLYPKRHPDVRAVEADLELRGRINPKLRKRLLKRMGDISMYLKELKQRFTRWYNRQHDRYGTIWAERFKSVLVEDQPEAILTLLKYFDLNAVRAGMVTDPKDYRFCGYAEALSVGGKARQGLAGCLPGKNWAEQSQYYRQLLLIQSGVSGHSDKRALTREEIRAKLGKEGVLPLNLLLHLRVRYFTDGAVLGSRAFVDKVYRRFRQHFGKRRKDGARPMKAADWGGLMVLRSLQRDVFG